MYLMLQVEDMKEHKVAASQRMQNLQLLKKKLWTHKNWVDSAK